MHIINQEINDCYKYHFVYKTINLINGKYYIGVHSTNDLNDGYLGSGDRICNAINKYGVENFNREILLFFESRDIAFFHEWLVVTPDFILRDNTYNLVEGGRKPPNHKGTKRREESKMNLEGFILRYGEIVGHIEYKLWCVKIRKNNLKKSKRIICIETGEIFECATDASIAKIGDKRALGRIYECGKGKASEAFGYTWRFVDNNDQPIDVQFNHIKKKKVICLETGEIFNCPVDGARKYDPGVEDGCGISKCARGKKKSEYGLTWRYLDKNDQIIHVEFKDKREKKVLCIETNEIFNTIKDACQKYQNIDIYSCVEGRQKTAGGLHWKLIQ